MIVPDLLATDFARRWRVFGKNGAEHVCHFAETPLIRRPAARGVAMGLSERHSACVIHAAQSVFVRQLYTSARANWF